MTFAQIQSPDGGEDLVELARALPTERRRMLSAELAARTDAPQGLIRFLALDEIGIAEPVILQSPVLTEGDFSTIARRGSPAHLATLRQRSDLPQKIKTQLAEHCRAEKKLMAELRAGNIDAFRSMLSELAGKNADPALEALDHGSGRPLANICKSAGLSRAAFSSIVLLTDPSRATETTQSLLSSNEMGETNQSA